MNENYLVILSISATELPGSALVNSSMEFIEKITVSSLSSQWLLHSRSRIESYLYNHQEIQKARVGHCERTVSCPSYFRLFQYFYHHS